MPRTIPEQRIANLMKAATSVNRYIKDGRPLTGLQLESISLAVQMLDTFLKIYRIRVSKRVIAKNQPARSWFTNQAVAAPLKAVKRNAAAVALGRLGGLKGGRARAAKLSPQKRTALARLAARARWAGRRRRGEVQ
jgi:hypothetical protein